MSHKYFDGVVENPKINEEIDTDLISAVTSLKAKVDEKWLV